MANDPLPDGPFTEIKIGNFPVYRWYRRGEWFRRGRDGWIKTNGIHVPADILRASERQIIEDGGQGQPVARDTERFSRLADEPRPVLPEGYSAELSGRSIDGMIADEVERLTGRPER